MGLELGIILFTVAFNNFGWWQIVKMRLRPSNFRINEATRFRLRWTKEVRSGQSRVQAVWTCDNLVSISLFLERFGIYVLISWVDGILQIEEVAGRFFNKFCLVLSVFSEALLLFLRLYCYYVNEVIRWKKPLVVDSLDKLKTIGRDSCE